MALLDSLRYIIIIWTGDTESHYWEHMTPACMTEESDAENAEKIVTHQLLWRSECEFMCERDSMCVYVLLEWRERK